MYSIVKGTFNRFLTVLFSEVLLLLLGSLLLNCLGSLHYEKKPRYIKILPWLKLGN